MQPVRRMFPGSPRLWRALLLAALALSALACRATTAPVAPTYGAAGGNPSTAPAQMKAHSASTTPPPAPLATATAPPPTASATPTASPTPAPTATPTPTATATSTPSPTPPPTATETPSPVPSNNVLRISALEYGSSDEYVEITNDGPGDQDMAGWTLHSRGQKNPFHFPSGYRLPAGGRVRIHSGRDALDAPPGDLKWSGAYYWNNDGDEALLYDAAGKQVHSWSY